MDKTNNAPLFLLLLTGLICCFLNCDKYSTSDRDYYSFREWNSSLGDSLIVTFSIDTIFKPVSSGMDCFDEGDPCHTFGNYNTKISMNYSTYPKRNVFESLAERGEIKTWQIRDAYPEQSISRPKITKLGMLDGVMVESSSSNFHLVDYAGYNKEMYMWFDIKVKSRDTTLDVKNILLSLVRSISIHKK